jgi:Fe-S-cluster containining protein
MNMSIEQRVQLVESLFSQLEFESAQFNKLSGLGCAAGCGKCCTYPNVEASPLEFLPWAFNLFINDEAENMLLKLAENKSSTCMIYKSLTVFGGGRCSDYKFRGLICRLFGSAANTDKYGILRLATCKIIKEGQAENYNSTSLAIEKGMKIPIFTEYYMQLNQIDFQMANQIVPVNLALKMAIEEVLQYYSYRPLTSADKLCS